MIRTAPRGPAEATGEAGGTCMEHAPNAVSSECAGGHGCIRNPRQIPSWTLESELPKGVEVIFFRPVVVLGLRCEGHPKEARACLY
jgi:hypothetical protein